MSRIGYQFLSSAEKKVYDQFLHAFRHCAPTVELVCVDKKIDVMKVLKVAINDNPDVIYFPKTSFTITKGLFSTVKIDLNGAFPLQQAKLMQQQLNKELDRAVEEILSRCPVSTYEKLICIYEYMQDHFTYDNQESEAHAHSHHSIHPLSHNAYGAMINKVAVCDGLSAAFALIAGRLGFDCCVMSGQSDFQTGVYTDHAWNIIKVSDAYYHIDVTWDINHKESLGEYAYEYFCVTDTAFDTDHNWDMSHAPRCTKNDLSFYVRNDCIANTPAQLDEIFIRYAKSKQKVVRVKLGNALRLTEPVHQTLGEHLMDIASAIGRRSGLSFTWNRNTRCFYAKFSS